MNSILIHNNKGNKKVKLSLFQKQHNTVDFKPNNDDIDTYISEITISDLKKKAFEIVFIKDNLSDNYLELLGLRVAYHIRLSQELGDKRFVPIVIISDVDACILNQLEPMANILFTKNIFIIPNTKEAIENFQTKDILPLSQEGYQTKFLNKIEILPPQDYPCRRNPGNSVLYAQARGSNKEGQGRLYPGVYPRGPDAGFAGG